MSHERFIETSERFKTWCCDALEFWHHRAVDPRGGFAEHLDLKGVADFDHVRRVRVQARQAYVYAHAAYLGWYSDSKKASDVAWDFATGLGSAGGAFIPDDSPRGCAHLVNGDGSMNDDTRDTYAQAFILLSGAWRFKAFADTKALLKANETIEYLNNNLKSSFGGWLEAMPIPKEKTRRQNPHMHLFEAFLALYASTQKQVYLDYAHEMFSLFEKHFFHSSTGALLEFFHTDWTPFKDGGPVEPGHMMEWSWLLQSYSDLSGVDVQKYAIPLYDSGLEYGLNSKLGLICDAVNLDGTEHSLTLRTWPQTELIKASVARARRENSDLMFNAASNTIEALFKFYLSGQVKGGWDDKLSPEGGVISKVMPTSTFYHLFCAAAEVDLLAQTLK